MFLFSHLLENSLIIYNISIYFFAVGILFIFIKQTHQINKTGSRYPSYSLQNMPKTDFTCRGKILGGYYADADTQCQMFHICVKVAGVGVGHEHFNDWRIILIRHTRWQ